MPKQVDREERRREIAAAVLRLVATRGVEAASLRAVAAEAGVSMGAVQHYFTTRDEMLRFALGHGNALLAERGTRLLTEHQPPPRTRHSGCSAPCCCPSTRTAGPPPGSGPDSISRGCVDEPTRELAALAYTNLTDFLVRQIRDARPEADTDQPARHLVSVIEGLRWPVLFGVYTEQQALDILDAQLDLIFNPAA